MPITPVQVGVAAAEAVGAGAQAVHVHPRGVDGVESLAWVDIRAAVEAVRGTCPGVPVGVSTREGIVPEVAERVRLVGEWERGPDFASVNFHEVGAEWVADTLTSRGIGVEAGLFTLEAARRYLAWGGEVTRVLVEAIAGISPGVDGIAAAQAVLEVLGRDDVLVHGENGWAWPVLRWAQACGYDIRVGLEDMLSGPEGQPVKTNADLVSFL